MARFLVLDNDRPMRGLLALAVERGGHEVLQAGTVDEAEAAMQASEPVDGMLLDLHLGGGHSGVSVVARWRESGLLAPFMVVTGTPEDASLSELDGEPRYHGVLAKPFPLDELLRRVEMLTQVSEQVEDSEPIAEAGWVSEPPPDASMNPQEPEAPVTEPEPEPQQEIDREA